VLVLENVVQGNVCMCYGPLQHIYTGISSVLVLYIVHGFFINHVHILTINEFLAT
jgi:hypothetical protein